MKKQEDWKQRLKNLRWKDTHGNTHDTFIWEDGEYDSVVWFIEQELAIAKQEMVERVKNYGKLFSLTDNPKEGIPSSYIHLNERDYYVIEMTSDIINELSNSER